MTAESSFVREILFSSDLFEVVRGHWKEGHVSELHNHGWSHCAIRIEEGIFENTLDLGLKREVQLLKAGDTMVTPVGARHEFACKSVWGKTIHVYTPKIVPHTDQGQFAIPAKDLNFLNLGQATSIDELKSLLETMKAQSVSTWSPYFMNQLFTGVLPHTLMAEDFITQTKTTMATYEAAPVFSDVEIEVVANLGRQIGWDEKSRAGVAVPGGSAANFMALHCARHKAFPELKACGLDGRRLVVFVSEDAHYSLKKASAVLGFGTANLKAIPVDESRRMNVKALKESVRRTQAEGAVPLAVVATAGTTVYGSFDPIDAIADVCDEFQTWLHVDGAWGGPVIFSENARELVKGIDRADSVTFDAHKLYGAGLTCSFFLTRHFEVLLSASDVSGADYLFHEGEGVLDRGRLSWQCGRRADALSFWTLWKNVGTKGLGQFVDRLLEIKNETIRWIEGEPRFELVGKNEFLNVCVRVQKADGSWDGDWSRQVRERLKAKNLAFVNYSQDEKGTFLRLILAHPYLTFAHVKQILEWALEE